MIAEPFRCYFTSPMQDIFLHSFSISIHSRVMGSSESSHNVAIPLSNPNAYSGIRVNHELEVQSVINPLVWDQDFSFLVGSTDDARGKTLGALLGDSNARFIKRCLDASHGHFVTLLIRPSMTSQICDVVVCACVEPSKGCCASPTMCMYFIPAHQASTEKFLSRENSLAVAQTVCVRCGAHTVDGVRVESAEESLVESCRKGRTMLHRVVRTSCSQCNIELVHSLRNVARKSSVADTAVPILSPRAASAFKKSCVILVCSSENQLLSRHCSLIEQMGLTAVPFTAASGVLRHIDSSAPAHMVVTDVLLPSVSGTELMKLLIKRKCDIPIVAVAGSAAFSQLALSCGATTFLLRQSSDSEFKRAIFSLLE